ncbi:MAG TPA: SDR family NAD(P)-dependent oxidoreductase, partial [Burkholderiaceae bacterium]
MRPDDAWLVTGASSGIGRALARRLAARGQAVWLAGRDVAAMRALRDGLRARHPGAAVEVDGLDLASRQSIEAGVERWASRGLRFAVLVNNAGVSMSRFGRCEDGFEWTWATNVRGPYLLSRALAGRGLFADGAQVLNVASSCHARRLDGRCFERYGRLGGADAYLQSKLCLILQTRALGAEPGQLRFNAVHPGIVRSRLGRDGRVANLVGRAVGLFLPPADRAARVLEQVAERVARCGLNRAWLDAGEPAELGYDGDLDADTARVMAALAADVVPGGPATASAAGQR